jgi:hypothetical protein
VKKFGKLVGQGYLQSFINAVNIPARPLPLEKIEPIDQTEGTGGLKKF